MEADGFIYPDAAWRPNPRDPPLTTATLPFKLKMLVKSCSCTSCSADAMMIVCIEYYVYGDNGTLCALQQCVTMWEC